MTAHDPFTTHARWYDIRVTLGRIFLRRPAARYGSALGIVGMITAGVMLVPVVLQLETLQLLYVLVVLATAVLSGFGPAMLAATTSFICLNFFFVSPRYTLWIARPEDGLRLAEFWVAAFLSGALAAYARHQTDRAERRVLEISTLHTLTLAMEAEATLQGRLDQIAATTANLLGLPFCTITLHTPPCTAIWGTRQEVLHDLTIPIRHEAETIGSLQAGLPRTRQFAPEEQYLLRLITTQLRSVLDRARMLDAAAQARMFQASDQLKSAILSSISHDLRTPLTTIQGAVSELKATDVDWTPATRRQLLDAIDEEAERLRRLVGNLLDLSRLRSGALLPHTDWYALDEIIYHTLDHQRMLLHGHEVAVQLPADLPLMALDFVLTEQVLANLLQNAVQYGAPDTTITISVAQFADHLVCRIANTGPPIPALWHERMFEPFVRVPGTTVAGSGLGLAICRGFLEAQGGTLALDPSVQDGVAITITLPLTPAGRPLHG
jgi:two-component system, OmpR family, sensor histidine kinase KdpD